MWAEGDDCPGPTIAASDGCSFKPFRLKCSRASDLLGVVEVEHKLWVYDDDFVAWELRRLLIAFYSDRHKLDPCHQIRLERKDWEQLFDTVSIRWRQNFFPAARAFAVGDGVIECDDAEMGAPTNDRRIREVASVSTPGLLLILLQWVKTKRQRAHRERAWMLWLGLMSKCIPPDDARDVSLQDILDESTHLCIHSARGGLCSHVEEFFGECRRGSDEHTHSSIGLRMGMLLTHVGDCPAAAAGLHDTLILLGSMIDAAVVAIGDCDIAKWTNLQGPCGKKRRLGDADLRNFLLGDNVLQGRASSATASTKSQGVHSNTTQCWLEKHRREYLEAAWSVPGPMPRGVYSLAEDGARFGQPARETQAYALWVASSDQAVWLPIQEPMPS